MFRVLMLLACLFPAAAAAQDAAVPADVDPGSAPHGWPTLQAAAAAAGAPELRQIGRAQPPPPPPENRRRRPSMVGYINDAAIQSQVRVRFDAGAGVDAPDRAEFFYAKCGCYRDLPATVPLRDPDAPGPGPGIVSDLNFQQLYLQAEFAMRDRLSVYGELPVRWLQPQSFAPGFGSFDDQSGLSDLRLGVKLALVASPEQYLTVQVQGNLPTGDPGKGLGVDHFSVEPALLYNRGVNDRVNMEAQLGFVFPAGSSNGIATTADTFAGDVLYYGFGPSVEVYRSAALRIAPVVELVGWHVFNGFQTSTLSEIDGLNIVNLKIGSRFELRDASSIYVGYGRGLSDDVWYEDVFRVEYRFTFGR